MEANVRNLSRSFTCTHFSEPYCFALCDAVTQSVKQIIFRKYGEKNTVYKREDIKITFSRFTRSTRSSPNLRQAAVERADDKENVGEHEGEVSFEDMGLHDALLRGIYAYGFEQPSVIQQRAIRPCIQGTGFYYYFKLLLKLQGICSDSIQC